MRKVIILIALMLLPVPVLADYDDEPCDIIVIDLVDQNGHIIPESNGYGDNVVVGSASYEEWAAIVKKYLK